MGPPGCPVHTGHVLFAVRCASMGEPALCARRARIKCAAESCWRGDSRCSGVAPDSPVNYSGAPLDFPEGDEFDLESSGAPDTVRWHTGQSSAPDQRCLRLSLCSFVEPNTWSFYWLSVNLWHLYDLYTRAN